MNKDLELLYVENPGFRSENHVWNVGKKHFKAFALGCIKSPKLQADSSQVRVRPASQT